MISPFDPEAAGAIAYTDLLEEDPTRVLILSNEIASPLYGPDGTEGNYGSFARRLAESVAPHGIGIYAHQRLGSDHTHYNADTAIRLTPHNRPETMIGQARRIATNLVSIFPGVKEIGLVGHSAGGVESIDLALAMMRDGDTRTILGRATITNLVAFDVPRHRHFLTAAGIARYLAYLPYERLLATPPKSAAEEAPATDGALARFLVDTRYNAGVWTRGVQANLEAIARCLPNTSVHLLAASHSPNNIAHLPGPKAYVKRMNHLRDGVPTTAPHTAELYKGTHAGGSRNTVIMQTLAQAGIIR